MSNPFTREQLARKVAYLLPLRHHLTLVFLAILLFIGVISPRLSQPYGGFHSTNETFFSTIAKNYSIKTLLEPTTYHGDTDYTLPPFLSHLLFIFFKFFGDGALQARIVIVFFSCLCILLTYLLGAEIHSPPAGAIASLMLATTPMMALVGRNVQTDPVYLSLTMGALWLFFVAERKGSRKLMISAGIVFALALFTKQFPVFFTPVILFRAVHGLIIKRHGWRFYSLFLIGILIIPLPYYLIHIIKHPEAFFSVQQRVHMQKFKWPNQTTVSRLTREAYFGFSMIWSPVFAWGALWILFRRKPKELCLLAAIAVLAGFNLVCYWHTYYLLGLVPLLAITGGISLYHFFGTRGVWGTLLLTPLAVYFCFSLLSANKYDWLYYHQVCSILKSLDPAATILKPEGDSSGPILHYFLPTLDVRKLNQTPTDKATGRLELKKYHYRCFFVKKLTSNKKSDVKVFQHTRGAPAPMAFGIALVQEPANINFFRAKSMTFHKAGPIWKFGIHIMPQKLISVTVCVPPYLDIFKVKPQKPGDELSYKVIDPKVDNPTTFISR